MLGYAAASDVFGASLYEPFGQIDLVGNLYGATATNRDTGGYHDKITPLRLKTLGAPEDTGNGVLFRIMIRADFGRGFIRPSKTTGFSEAGLMNGNGRQKGL